LEWMKCAEIRGSGNPATQMDIKQSKSASKDLPTSLE
jgi:hypothetical protein